VMGAPATAAQTHAILRARSGFDINQLASEYRALRASVLRQWTEACQPGDINLEDVIRFNEAIDQALAESVQFLATSGAGAQTGSVAASRTLMIRSLPKTGLRNSRR
jgi:hypothetical protein